MSLSNFLLPSLSQDPANSSSLSTPLCWGAQDRILGGFMGGMGVGADIPCTQGLLMASSTPFGILNLLSKRIALGSIVLSRS